MKIYQTKRFVYSVSQNEDGTLDMNREYSISGGYWSKASGRPDNAGLMVKNAGGIDKMLASCQDVEDLKAYAHEMNVRNKEQREKGAQRKAIADEERARQRKADYDRLFNEEVTESNEETVGALLRYLNTQNWGVWKLPKMTISYQCNQYDCDGKQATTIKLDSPIMVNDVPGTMFQVGAPHGHLMKYRRI